MDLYTGFQMHWLDRCLRSLPHTVGQSLDVVGVPGHGHASALVVVIVLLYGHQHVLVLRRLQECYRSS